MNEEQAEMIAAQARSFCWQFTEGAISLSEFLYATVALYTANDKLVNELHAAPESEW